jgi:putative glycosyltransferase (TIGR04372 family)
MKIQRFCRRLASFIKGDYPGHSLSSKTKKTWLSALIIKHNIRYKIIGLLFGKNLHINSKGVSELSFIIEKFDSYKPNISINYSLRKSAVSLLKSDFDFARQILDKAKKQFPESPELYKAYAQLEYKEKGDISAYNKNEFKAVELLRSQPSLIWPSTYQFRVVNHEWTYAIGHLGILDSLIKFKQLGFFGDYEHVIFTSQDRIANKCYLSYFQDFLEINVLSREKYWLYSNIFSSSVEYVSAWQLREGIRATTECMSLSEECWKKENRKPLLMLKDEHREQGIKILEKLGLPSDSWFVALHVRGSGYEITNNNPTDGRNNDIRSYIPAIKSIINAGGFVIRMGHSSMRPLPPMPNVIDYINTPYKSDLVDVFLWASCRFFIGSLSGPMEIPKTFGVPSLLTNANAFGFASCSRNGCLMIPKLWYSKRYDRLLTFSEMLAVPHCAFSERRTVGDDLVLVDNSEDEIKAGVDEMLEITSFSGVKNYPYYVESSYNALQVNLDYIREKNNVIGRLPVSRYFLSKHSCLIK